MEGKLSNIDSLFAFRFSLYKPISKYKRKINKLSVENNLYSQSNSSIVECNWFLKTMFILNQNYMIENVCCIRLKIY
jgi:hypothetical protein